MSQNPYSGNIRRTPTQSTYDRLPTGEIVPPSPLSSRNSQRPPSEVSLDDLSPIQDTRDAEVTATTERGARGQLSASTPMGDGWHRSRPYLDSENPLLDVPLGTHTPNGQDLKAPDQAVKGLPPSENTNSSRPRAPAWRLWLYSWWPELSCGIISIASLIGLIVVLRDVNGKSLPDWPLGLTLNTLIAFLSTICRAAFIIMIAEGLSQLKWLHFRQGTPLTHFQIFDDASRGPWGSIRLMTVTGCWPVGLLPALVLVSALLTSTLTQSVVSYPTRLAPVPGNPNATASRAGQYFWNTANTFSQMEHTSWVEQHIYQGLNQPYMEELELDTPKCTTSECRWKPFSSLAICGTAWNVTELLKIDTQGGRAMNASLPNGAFLDLSVNHLTLVGLRSGYQSVSFPNDSDIAAPALFNYFVLYATDSDQVIGAAELLLHFCSRQYNASVSGNIPSQEVLKSSIEVVHEPTEVAGWGELNITAVKDPNDPDKRFPFGGTGVDIMRTTLGRAMNGTYGRITPNSDSEGSAPARFSSGFEYASVALESAGRVNVSEDVVLREVMGNITGNIATSLTNSLNNPFFDVLGETLGPETFVAVRWAWLALIASQVVLSIAFLVIVMIQTSRAGIAVVKGSSLSVLFAISADDKARLERGLGDQKHQGDFGRAAKDGFGIVGNFKMAERGWTLRNT
ncbi:hypothetical protein FDECE_10360 [Fusarium decemcellulare]|nr:hypothetical protein FDECE_10360 [Fusarium decemcellulare]